MSKNCVICGSVLHNGICPYCHEEYLIEEQYIEENMIVPQNIFNEAREQEKKIRKNRDEIRKRIEEEL